MWVQIIGALLILVVLVIIFWRFWFLRLPDRKIPKKGVVSPAFGKVIKIIRFEKGEPLDIHKGLLGSVKTITKDVSKSGYVVVIMLNVSDVHYQRAPDRATLLSQKHTRGKFRNAVFGSGSLEATFENEKNEMVFTEGSRRFKVVQVAGVLARRIVSYVERGQKVNKGEVIGLINLGSQVVIVLPDCELQVAEGERVVDGESVIACWKD